MKTILLFFLTALAIPAMAGNDGANWRPKERWRGFNLPGLFIKEWSPGHFDEFDFEVMREWGFNFARLPMDYRYWIQDGDWEKIDESKFAPIDQAVKWGKRYGIHVQLSFHRAPGYTVAKPTEAKSLFNDADALRVCCQHWAFFARRYKGIPNEEVSFNLFNEPPDIEDEEYGKVAKALIEAIRHEDPLRFIVADGLSWGTRPAMSLLGIPGVGQASRGYSPMPISHYRASWIQNSDVPPVWPINPFRPTCFCYGPGKSPWNTPLVLKGVPPCEARIRFERVSGPVAFRVAKNGEQIQEIELVPQTNSPAWTNAVYYPDWKIVQGTPREEFSIRLADQPGDLTFSVTKGDWVNLKSIRFVSPKDGRESVLTFDNTWGKPINHEQRFTGWNNGDSFRIDTPSGEFQPKYADAGMEYLYRKLLVNWDKFAAQGGFYMVGEFGAFKYTPHEMVMDWLEDYLRLWKERGAGWAMWNLRGQFGILDSNRADVQYETFRGHQLDRKMLDLLRKY
ncbi:MAG: cellulase family glycosylhydrolase [Kiritimatiellae bacterium]|nr:cellulase family glycosylhydrolase [Kiritimatiellia bacterium]